MFKRLLGGANYSPRNTSSASKSSRGSSSSGGGSGSANEEKKNKIHRTFTADFISVDKQKRRKDDFAAAAARAASSNTTAQTPIPQKKSRKKRLLASDSRRKREHHRNSFGMGGLGGVEAELSSESTIPRSNLWKKIDSKKKSNSETTCGNKDVSLHLSDASQPTTQHVLRRSAASNSDRDFSHEQSSTLSISRCWDASDHDEEEYTFTETTGNRTQDIITGCNGVVDGGSRGGGGDGSAAQSAASNVVRRCMTKHMTPRDYDLVTNFFRDVMSSSENNTSCPQRSGNILCSKEAFRNSVALSMGIVDHYLFIDIEETSGRDAGSNGKRERMIYSKVVAVVSVMLYSKPWLQDRILRVVDLAVVPQFKTNVCLLDCIVNYVARIAKRKDCAQVYLLPAMTKRSNTAIGAVPATDASCCELAAPPLFAFE